jgi:5-(carboxyamino)imidazole ribonucleotide synthase
MDLCHKSQFDYLVDIALKNPLEIPQLKFREGAMINLLGKTNLENPKLFIPEISEIFPYQIYLYGKRFSRIGRKMGHLNILNPSLDTNFISSIEKIYSEYTL